MIRIELKEFIRWFREVRGERIKLGDIHEEMGVHRNVLSKLMNRPYESTTTEQIGKIAEFFFLRLRKPKNDTIEDLLLMQVIISSLVQVYPDEAQFAIKADPRFPALEYKTQDQPTWLVWLTRYSQTTPSKKVLHVSQPSPGKRFEFPLLDWYVEKYGVLPKAKALAASQRRKAKK